MYISSITSDMILLQWPQPSGCVKRIVHCVAKLSNFKRCCSSDVSVVKLGAGVQHRTLGRTTATAQQSQTRRRHRQHLVVAESFHQIMILI